MSWGEEVKKREENIRKKLQKDGVQLLEAIRKEVARKTPEEVTTNPDLVQIIKLFGTAGDREKLPPMIQIGETRVDLTIRQHHTTGSYSGYHWQDRLAVKVDWVWLNGHIYHKSKSFAHSSKMRQETFGFDVPKIADYIIWWVGEKRKILGEIQAKKAKKERAEEVKGEWELARKRVVDKFPNLPPKASIEATPSGLVFTITTDEKRLERILKALE